VSAPYLREPAIAYGVFAVVAAAVVLWWAPTPAMRNPVTAILLALLLTGGFEGLRRVTAREEELGGARPREPRQAGAIADPPGG
jgi:hypothetical protein